jgi:MFS family permease
MNIGLLMAPFLAGAIYEHAGYDAVFAVLLIVNALAFGLRAAAIEKKDAARWLQSARLDDSWLNDGSAPVGSGRTSPTTSHGHWVATKDVGPDEQTAEPSEDSPLLPYRSTKNREWISWLSAWFHTATILLSSKRLNAAVYGGFLHTLIISSFDTILPIFVMKTFHWKATASGLVFLAITVPSLLSTYVGMLSDRYGPRWTSLSGFALVTPALALLALSRNDSTTSLALMIIALVSIGKHPFRLHISISSPCTPRLNRLG